MRQIRLAWILPPMGVVLAEASIWVARHPHSRVRGDIYCHSTFELICLGLNAPVERGAILIYTLLGSWVGVFSGDLIYLLLAAMFWYFVGKKLDTYRYPKVNAQVGMSIGKVFANALTILYAFYLLLAISLHNVIFTKPSSGNGGSSNYYGDLIRQTLWFLWSLILIFIPGVALARLLQRRRAASLDPC